MQTVLRHSKRTIIALIGGIVVLIGLVMVPYPGPGWLVVFLGLGILATEFAWAQRLLHRLKNYYEAWKSWLAKQTIGYRISFLLLTGVTVVMTIWLLNGFGFMETWLGLGLPWLHAPYLY